MRLGKFLNFSKVLKNFLEHPYYFCIKRIFWKRFIPTTFVFSYFLLKRIIPTTFVVSLVLLEKKLFKNYQIFSEKSPKFQKLFRKQTYSFLWNIYPCSLVYKRIIICYLFGPKNMCFFLTLFLLGYAQILLYHTNV